MADAGQPTRSAAGMTLLEIVCALAILGLVGLFGTRLLDNFVRGYTVARNADATVQKAQNALQRLTLEFTYLDMAQATGTANSITYNSVLDNVTVSVFQSGNAIVYQRAGTNYTLTDGVAAGSLAFNYYTMYNGAAMNAATNNGNVQLIWFRYNMIGSDSSLGFSQTYATRVKVNKIQ